MRVLMLTQAVDLDHPVLGFTNGWIRGLARGVERVHVLTLERGRCELPQNVSVHALGGPGARASRARRWGFYGQQLGRLVLGGLVDLVFVHMVPRWVMAAAPFCSLRRMPIVLWYAHGAVDRDLRLAHMLVDRVLTSSPEGCRLRSRKVVSVGHGIDTRLFRPGQRQPDGLFSVLSAGRLSPVKGYEELVEATRLLVRERGMERLRVRLVGGPALPADEDYARSLRQLVAAHRLGEHIKLVGPVPYRQMPEEYWHSDLFVSLSRTGSLDKVALEAMACGLPVLTSNRALQRLLSAEPDLQLADDDASTAARAIADVAAWNASRRVRVGLELRGQVEQEHSLERLVGVIGREFELAAHRGQAEAGVDAARG